MKAFRHLRYKKIYWTEHSQFKMRQYGISKSKLLQLLYKPERKEKGIAAGTVALMQTKKSYQSKRSQAMVKNKKPPGELWLMYKDVKDTRKIISAWRYPGTSKPGEAVDIITQYSD